MKEEKIIIMALIDILGDYADRNHIDSYFLDFDSKKKTINICVKKGDKETKTSFKVGEPFGKKIMSISKF